MRYVITLSDRHYVVRRNFDCVQVMTSVVLPNLMILHLIRGSYVMIHFMASSFFATCNVFYAAFAILLTSDSSSAEAHFCCSIVYFFNTGSQRFVVVLSIVSQ